MAVLNTNPLAFPTPDPEVLGKMLDSVGLAYFVFGAELVVVSRNLRARGLTGNNDVLGHRAREFLSADSARKLAELLPDGTPRDVELKFIASEEALLVPCVAQKTDTFTHVVENSSGRADTRKQTEQALAASDRSLRIIIDHLPVLLWTTDKQLNVTSVSGTEWTMSTFRPSAENILGTPVRDHFWSEQATKVAMEAHSRSLAGDASSYEVSTGDRCFLGRTEPLRNEKGDITGVLGVAVDITERHEAELVVLRRAQQQSALAALGQHALEGCNSDLLYAEAMHAVRDELKIDIAGVFEHLEDGTLLLAPGGVGWRELGYESSGPSHLISHADATLRCAHALVFEDLMSETRFRSSLLARQGVVSGVSVIVHGENRPNGVLTAYSRSRRTFGAGDISFLQAVANVLSLAIENRRAHRTRTLLVEQLITAQENERAKVARELHDDSGQTFTALLVGLRSIRDTTTLEAAKERAVELGAIASAAVASVGRVARGLHPSVLDSFGLAAAIQQAVTDFTSVYGIPVHLSTGGLKPHELSPLVELALYRMLQESLTNIAKHAAAKEVDVEISTSDGLAKLSIRDDGVGFDVSKERSAANKLGLRSMSERAALLGGLLRVESSPLAGTTITAEVPLYKGTEDCKS